MVESQSCCCFFSAKTGVMIFGVLAFLGLLGEIEEFVPSRFGCNLGIFLSFLIMMLMDTERNRKWFFISYTISSLILMIVMFYLTQKGVFKENPWVVGCSTMKAEGKFQEFGVSNQKECETKLGTIVQTFLGTMFLLSLALQYHFILVAYTHWKNHAKDNSSEMERRRLADEV